MPKISWDYPRLTFAKRIFKMKRKYYEWGDFLMERIGTWKMDICTVELATEASRLHLSNCNPRRYRTLDEVKAAKDKFLPKDLFSPRSLSGRPGTASISGR